MRLFEIRDRTGRIIYITLERWHHIPRRHPNIVGCFEEIQATIAYPTAFRKSEDKPDVRLYYRYHKDPLSDEEYLSVVVKYLNGEGFVIPSHFTNKLHGLP